MPDYQKGKIYKIVNDSSDLVYYGSTVQPLHNRFHIHKHGLRDCTSKKIFEGENPHIILVEKYPCADKYELQKKEREYIEGNICVNRQIPGRTRKEYIEDNKEYIFKKRKEYIEKNKNIISEKRKEYLQENKVKIQKKDKEYYEKNKQIISEKRKVKYTCECGSSFNKNSKARHERSIKHQNFINNK